MNKFTPGPWGLYTGSEDKNIIAVSHWKKTEHGGHVGLCVAKMPIPTDNVPQDAINANAKLIAVAPEMLDELYSVLPFLQDMLDDPCYKTLMVAVRIKAINILIAKATS